MSLATRSSACALAIVLGLAAAACADGQEGGVPAVQVEVDGVPLSGALSVAFADTSVGDMSTLSVTIRNTGDASLLLTRDPPVRLERDDRLAFRLTQPPEDRIAVGATTTFEVSFAPNVAGPHSARLVIESNIDAADGLVIGLIGDGLSSERGALTITHDGQAVGEALDLGHAVVGDQSTLTLTLTNEGTGVLALTGLAPIEISGDDAAAIQASSPSTSSLPPGGSTSFSLTFTPTRCGPIDASLTIHTDAASETIALLALGATSPVVAEALVTAGEPDVSIAASADGSVLAIADRAADAFAGTVQMVSFDGCEALSRQTLTPASERLPTNALFGTAVALSQDGRHMAVSALGSVDAWLYEREPEATRRYTLSTDEVNASHGAAMGMDPTGSVVAVGQPAHDSGFNPHGAVFIWTAPEQGWADADDASAKLIPESLTQTTGMGQAVEVVRDAIVAAGLLGQDPASGRAAAFVFARAEDGQWGRAKAGAALTIRVPSAQLVASDGVPSGGAASIAVAADGSTVAITVPASGGVVLVYVFTRPADGWSDSAAPQTERARLRLTGSPHFRATVASDGRFLIGGDAEGLRQLDRPAQGWSDLVEVARTWPLAVLGELTLARDDALLVAATPTGGVAFIWR